ncbi:flavin monoamine oxidase family protein [Streptomyces spiramyceticus]|uniref:flavin monoamine oxidase family protein n=1 Tax=Streptomyces spiramyceticus TaxID=299717 RepID=UPI00237A6E87|nr:FAD-dependent oxidoreductase [Streptomyces spiramyceticus]
MSRTNTMHALRRLAAEHAAARRLRMPAAEVRGSTRRELLGRAAALGLGTALAGTAAAPAQAVVRAAAPRIAVVGAGIAGLTAALTLKDAGLNCTLYEASPDRVGGRMWTQRDHWAYGQTSEIGGELIDTSHKKMLELCRRFGLPVEDFLGGGPNGAEEVLWFNGAYYPREQADEDFKAVFQALHRDLQEAGEVKWNRTTPTGTALDNMSIYEWIDSRVPGGHASPLGRFMDVAYNVEYGADTTEQSALALVLLMGYQPNPGHFNVWGLSNERYHITGGNDQLPRAIAQSLPAGTLQMGKQLTAVRANANGTQTLTFTDAGTTTTVTADHTVLCVPLPVLQRFDLSSAGFDPLMTNLVRDARMGHCTKLNMQFTSRSWRGEGAWPGVSAGDCFTDSDVQQTWDTARSSVTRAESSSSSAQVFGPRPNPWLQESR